MKIKVIPNSSRSEIKEENGVTKVYLKSVPEKGKANAELIKFFKKRGIKVEIVSGLRSRNKVLRVLQN